MSPTQERERNIELMAVEAREAAREIGYDCGLAGKFPREIVSFEVVLDGMSYKFNILFKATIDTYGLKACFLAGYREGEAAAI